MELIYVYLGNVNGIDYDLGINLSQDKIVTYDKNTGEIDIQDRTRSTPESFFAKSIVNITAIIGQNGTGKSTILDVLGLLNKNKNSWQYLIIYRDDDKFDYESNELKVDFESRVSLKNNFQYAYIGKNNKDINLEFDRKNEFSRDFYFPELKNIFSLSESKKTLETFNFYYLNRIAYLSTGKYTKQFKKSNELLFNMLDNSIDSSITLDDKNIFIISIIKNFIFHFLCEINLNNYSQLDEFCKSIQNELKNNQQAINSGIFLNTINNMLYALIDDELYLNKKLDQAEDLNEIIKIILQFPHNILTLSKSPTNECILLIKAPDNKYINKILDYIDEHPDTDFLSFFYGEYSTGEFMLISLISQIHAIVEYETPSFNTKILLIDEFDQNLHPEWQRQYLNYVTEYFSKLNDSTKYQIIFTTHSPFVVSDLPRENIIKLSVDKETGKRTASFAEKSFASNFYEIMSDSFFLEDSVGEFAKNKINKLIGDIDALKSTSEYSEVIRLKQSIKLIDDEFIRDHLESRLDTKLVPKSEAEHIKLQIKALKKRLIEIEEKNTEDGNYD